jgi:flagellar assembly protein FliH
MSLRLERFEVDAPAGTVPAATVAEAAAQEQARLAAYEEGYAAGWDDAVAAQSGEATRLRADLAHSLQALSFTYREAETHVLSAVGPLVRAVIDALAPRTARAALGAMVAEALHPHLAQAGSPPATLAVHPSARRAVEAALPPDAMLPLTIAEEPTLGEGQAILRLGTAEVQVDLARAAEAVAQAVDAFFSPTEDPAHG